LTNGYPNKNKNNNNNNNNKVKSKPLELFELAGKKFQFFFKVLTFKIVKFLSLKNFVAEICVEGIWREVGKRCQVV
jgi:hypothetical protein